MAIDTSKSIEDAEELEPTGPILERPDHSDDPDEGEAIFEAIPDDEAHIVVDEEGGDISDIDGDGIPDDEDDDIDGDGIPNADDATPHGEEG